MLSSFLAKKTPELLLKRCVREEHVEGVLGLARLPRNSTKALFSFKKNCKIDIVVFSFVFDKYFIIIN